MTEREFTAFFKKYYRLLVYFSCKHVHNIEDAENIVQDCFIIFYNSPNLDQYEPKQLRSYIYMIVRHKSLNHLACKKKKKQLNEVHVPVLFIEKWFDDKMPNKEVDKDLISQMMHDYINGMVKGQREVMYLYYIKGLNTRQISRLLNKTVSTITNQMIRGRDALKDRFRESGLSERIFC